MLISITALLMPIVASALETTMTWQAGAQTVLFYATFDSTETGFAATLTTSSGEYDRIAMDARRSTLEWYRKVSIENTAITALRDGSRVRVSGTYQGKPYDKTHDFGNLPWYQLQEASYEYIFATGAKVTRFWTIDRRTLKPSEFKAELETEESVRIMGQLVPAIRYQLTIHGLPAFLFSARFWIRQTDGRFLKMDVAPVLGLPRSTVELTSES
jgi:hypothetical protein